MQINLAKAAALSKKALETPTLDAIILAPSGGGKSTLCGTFDVPTLYLYTTGESHGPKAATSGDNSKNVTPICFNHGYDAEEKTTRPYTDDEAYDALLSILKNQGAIKQMKIKAIAIDGISEIEKIIRGTSEWAKRCQTSQGKHSGFQEPAATIDMFRPIMQALHDLQRNLGIHFAMTCILDVKEVGQFGEVLEASPRILGYSVAEQIVQQFGDVLVVGKMENKGVVKYKLQFATDLVKSAKDERGRLKKMMNFSPRLSGFRHDDLPPLMDANLSEVLTLKTK